MKLPLPSPSSFEVALTTLLGQKMKPLSPVLCHTKPQGQDTPHTHLRELGAWLELLGAGPFSAVE